jgi:chromate reductase
VIGASVTDYGALWAQDHVRKALGIAGARVLESELPVGKAQHRFDEQGHLTDAETAERLEEILGALTAHRHALAAAA